MEQFDDFSTFFYDYVLDGTYVGVFRSEEVIETDESLPMEEETETGDAFFEEDFIEEKEEEFFEETPEESEEQVEKEENNQIEEVRNTKKRKTLVGRVMGKLLAFR